MTISANDTNTKNHNLQIVNTYFDVLILFSFPQVPAQAHQLRYMTQRLRARTLGLYSALKVERRAGSPTGFQCKMILCGKM